MTVRQKRQLLSVQVLLECRANGTYLQQAFCGAQKKTIMVKVYSNQPSVSFYCNDKLIATKEADHVFKCKVTLTDGGNHIRVVAGDSEDTATFVRTDAPANYKLSKKRSKSANWV